eukprot:gene8769-14035_t
MKALHAPGACRAAAAAAAAEAVAQGPPLQGSDAGFVCRVLRGALEQTARRAAAAAADAAETCAAAESAMAAADAAQSDATRGGSGWSDDDGPRAILLSRLPVDWSDSDFIAPTKHLIVAAT